MLDSCKVRPSDEHLSQYAPLEIWEEAVKQALRSPHMRHRTGAVIYNHRGIRAKGCSYKHNGSLRVNSIHAERHALSHLPKDYYLGVCLIVTLTRVNNFANCSRPCSDCAHALMDRMCGVIYAERTNDGGWAITETSADLLTRGYLVPTKYA